MTFRFRPGLTIAVASALAILITLGVWQLERRQWKLDLIRQTERLTASPAIPFDEALARVASGENMEYARVYIEGVYAHDLEARVFGTLDGAPGVYVFTPLDAPAAGGGRRFVYINRGFAPQAASDPGKRADGAPQGEVAVKGLLRAAENPPSIARLVRPVDQPEDNLWFARDPLRLAAHQGIETVPWYIDSSGEENPGAPWPKGGTTRIEFSNRHLEYALTWFGLAAALVGVYLAFSLKRR